MARRKKLSRTPFALAMMFAVASANGSRAAEQDNPQPPTLTGDQVLKARILFNNWNCGGCHILNDAEAYGDGGGSLDGNKHLDREFVRNRIANGINGMDSYRGLLTDTEIELLTTYILRVKK